MDLQEKKAKKDYDGDGKIETGEEEYKGSRDKAIKKGKKEQGSLLMASKKKTGRSQTAKTVLME